MEDSKKTLEPAAYAWTNLSRDGGQAVKEIGFTPPLYIPTDKLSPLYDRTTVEALARDAARFQWVERNWHAGLHIDYYGPESERPGYFHTWLVDAEVFYGEERYATYGEAVDAAIAREAANTVKPNEQNDFRCMEIGCGSTTEGAHHHTCPEAATGQEPGAQNGVKSAETRANTGFEVVPNKTETNLGLAD